MRTLVADCDGPDCRRRAEPRPSHPLGLTPRRQTSASAPSNGDAAAAPVSWRRIEQIARGSLPHRRSAARARLASQPTAPRRTSQCRP